MIPADPDVAPDDVEALILDRYLDGLLNADGGRREGSDRDPGALDPALLGVADVLRRSIVRVHPSFQFEERLAARLSAIAASEGGGSRLGALIPFRPATRASREGSSGDRLGDDDGALTREQPAARRSGAVRPLLIGGAITSAALSLAGVAWVARRTVRTPGLTELEGLL